MADAANWTGRVRPIPPQPRGPTGSRAGKRRSRHGGARTQNAITQLVRENDIATKGFTTSFTVDQTPDAVFAAINDVRGWWSGEIAGDTDRLGGEFTYRYKDVHRSTQKITAFVPGAKVVWQVTDAQLNFVADKTEWNGTEIVFEISRKGDKTEVRFQHVGLVPAFQCYGGCSGAWGFYVNESLRDYIVTGKAQPTDVAIP